MGDYKPGDLASLISGKPVHDVPNLFKCRRSIQTIEKENEEIESREVCTEHISGKEDENTVEVNKNEKHQRLPNKSSLKASVNNECTIFVGNVPLETPKKEVRKFFNKYGEIESLRMRGIAVPDMETSKRKAYFRSEFHPDRQSVIYYIRFKDADSAKEALNANMQEFRGNHIQVDKTLNKAKLPESLAVFVGNLPWEAEEEVLYKYFEDCGEITKVRIVRDSGVGASKGFGYVNFKKKASVMAALQKNGTHFQNRELRVMRCSQKKYQIERKKQGISQKGLWKGVFANQNKNRMNIGFMKKEKFKNRKKDFSKTRQSISSNKFTGIKNTGKRRPSKKSKRSKMTKLDKKHKMISEILAGSGKKKRKNK